MIGSFGLLCQGRALEAKRVPSIEADEGRVWRCPERFQHGATTLKTGMNSEVIYNDC